MLTKKFFPQFGFLDRDTTSDQKGTAPCGRPATEMHRWVELYLGKSCAPEFRM